MNAHRFLAFFLALTFLTLTTPAGAEWYKGATHVHSLWSDGDAAPETIAGWYIDHGWDFVCFSEHNTLQDNPDRFVTVSDDAKLKPDHVKAIIDRYGEDWPDLEKEDGKVSMRLRTHDELGGLLNKPGEFLLIPAEEMTTIGSAPHINAINLKELVKPVTMHPNRAKSIQAYLDAISAQRAQFGKPMFAHVNHVNFSDRVTTEELLRVNGLRFFEVYNGHPSVHSWGIPDKKIPSYERHWDIVLSMKLQEDPADLLYGVATDDSHNYHNWKVGESNPGRGWVMVQSDSLDPDAITQAMIDGKFYSSTGVILNTIDFDGKTLKLSIEGVPGVKYRTEFIGTKKGFDASSTPALDNEGNAIPRSSDLYSEEVGAVLHESADLDPSYTLQGDELYVRARIVSDKVQENPHENGDVEMGWTQPVAPE